MFKTVAVSALSLVIFASPAVAFALSAPYNPPSQDVQAKITALLAQIRQLQALIAELKGQTSSCEFTRTLTLGSKDTAAFDDVTRLQHYLQRNDYMSAKATGYYGFITAQAVGKLQIALGIVSSESDPAYGFMGPKTRAAICGTEKLPNTKASIKVDVDGSTFLTVAYNNLPTGSRLFLVDANNIDLNTDINNGTAVSGTGGIEYDAQAMEPGYYYVEAMVRTNTDLSVARSSAFYVGSAYTSMPMTNPVIIQSFHDYGGDGIVAKGGTITFGWESNLTDHDIKYWDGGCSLSALTASNRQIHILTGGKASGSVSHKPTETATYTLICTSGAKDGDPSDSSSLTVKVKPMTNPVVIESFHDYGGDGVTGVGETITFGWESNLTDHDIKYWDGGCSLSALTASNRQIHILTGGKASGSVNYTPTETATYTITCSSGAKDGDPSDKSSLTIELE